MIVVIILLVLLVLILPITLLTMTTINKPKIKHLSNKTDRILAVIALVTILAAWVIGTTLTEVDVTPSLQVAFPEADRFEPINGSGFTAIQSQPEETTLGYVALATANGYGGPMKVAVAVDLEGNIHGSGDRAAKRDNLLDGKSAWD